MLKRLTLNRIETVSAGKLLGIVNAVMGVFLGFLYGAMFAISAGFSGSNQSPAFALFLGGTVFVLTPVVMGVQGFVGGIILALVYNVAVSYIGGVVVEVDDQSEEDEI